MAMFNQVTKSDYILNGEPGWNYFWAMMVTFMQMNVYAISCLVWAKKKLVV